jgi:hypothetical protein
MTYRLQIETNIKGNLDKFREVPWNLFQYALPGDLDYAFNISKQECIDSFNDR